MHLFGERIESVTEQVLKSQLGNAAEGRTLEFKQELTIDKDSDKNDFLYEVCAFANSNGGFLLIGVKEQNGVAIELPGVQIKDKDSEILRIEQIIQNGIDPKIPGLRTEGIRLDNGNYVVVISIPRSFASPHMVTYKGASRFYSRNSGGKYPLDVQQLRVAFDLSGSLTDRIVSFRQKRLGKVIAGDTPVIVMDRPKVVLHVVPLNAFDPGHQFDGTDLTLQREQMSLLVFGTPYYHRLNFDGFLGYHQPSEDPVSPRYAQLFRNGIIEMVDVLGFHVEDGKYVRNSAIEAETKTAIEKIFEIYQRLGVDPPMIFMLSLLGVEGFRVKPGQKYFQKGHPIDRNELVFPEILIESFDSQEFMRAAKPTFDALWNAVGHPKSPNYKDGKWEP